MWHKIVNSIENSGVMVASAVIVVIVAMILHRLIKRTLNLLEQQGKLAPQVVASLKVVLRWFFLIVTLLLVLQTAGILQNVWAALLAIVAAVAVGFVAEWSVLCNTFSTLLILIYRPFKIGDTLQVPDVNLKGEVIDINFFYTTFMTEDNLVVQIPNKTFFFKPVVRTLGEESVSLYEQLRADKPTK